MKLLNTKKHMRSVSDFPAGGAAVWYAPGAFWYHVNSQPLHRPVYPAGRNLPDHRLRRRSDNYRQSYPEYDPVLFSYVSRGIDNQLYPQSWPLAARESRADQVGRCRKDHAAPERKGRL